MHFGMLLRMLYMLGECNFVLTIFVWINYFMTCLILNLYELNYIHIYFVLYRYVQSLKYEQITNETRNIIINGQGH